MTAVLLAAGCARRLKHVTRTRPKCLLEVGGRTLIEHQIDALERCGVTDIVVVIGHCAGAIRAALGRRVAYVVNEIYDRSNSLYSLSLALPLCRDGLIITNADVLLHPRLMARLLESPFPDALLYQPGRELGEEEMKVRLEGGRVVAMAKTLESNTYHGENLGVVKFSPGGVERLRSTTERLISEQHEVNAWAPKAFDELCRRYPLHAVSSGSLPWIEIDFPDDLERARQVIWPRIEQTLPQQHARQDGQ